MNEITTKEYVEKISNIKSIDCDLVRKKFVDWDTFRLDSVKINNNQIIIEKWEWGDFYYKIVLLTCKDKRELFVMEISDLKSNKDTNVKIFCKELNN